MKVVLSALVLTFVLGGTPTAFAAIKSNVMLSYTMKAIGKDIAFVVDPTKQDAGEATDAVILTAIIRARMISGLLQTAIDRRDGELLPGKIEETTDPETRKALSDQYAALLAGAQARLAELEAQYQTEVAKADLLQRAADRYAPPLRHGCLAAPDHHRCPFNGRLPGVDPAQHLG